MPHQHHQHQHQHHHQQQQHHHHVASHRCQYCTISELSFPARFQYFAFVQRCQPFAQCRGGPRVSIDTRASTPSHHNHDHRSHIIVVIVSNSSILLVFIFVIVIILCFIILSIGPTPTSPGLPLSRFSAVSPLHCPHSTRTRPRARSRASTRTRARSRASTGTRARLIFVQTQRYDSCQCNQPALVFL